MPPALTPALKVMLPETVAMSVPVVSMITPVPLTLPAAMPLRTMLLATVTPLPSSRRVRRSALAPGWAVNVMVPLGRPRESRTWTFPSLISKLPVMSLSTKADRMRRP